MADLASSLTELPDALRLLAEAIAMACKDRPADNETGDGIPATVQVVGPSRYVTIELAAAITGLSPSAIRTKIGKGIWLEGRQYVRREGRLFVDLRGYERWVESG